MNRIITVSILNFTVVFFLIILLFPTTVLPDDNSFRWKIGEELTYKVKWLFIRLGTIKVQVCDTATIDSTHVYYIKVFIDSKPELFFINMHSVYESYVDENFRILLFRAVEKIENVKYVTEYRFNYRDSLIHVKMTDIKDTTKTIVKDLSLNERIFDGITLIFFARANVHTTYQDTLTTIFEANKGDVAIHFKGIHEKKIKIGALDTKMDTYYLNGELLMKGIAGVTGPYQGWFAVDNQRPPLKAKFKVWIGSVTVELEEWKNWNSSLRE